MKTKNLIINLQYIALVAFIIAQCIVGKNFIIGQSIYLIANCISVFRDFVLDRPTADKIKDSCCFGLTLGLILLNPLK